jgi:serine/threonine protein kinase/tetratricopeptide (TPR) repeat protein
MLIPGSILGPYTVLQLLGAGGMGEVYRARDPRLGREVAIKVLPAAFSSDPARLRRFEREARSAAALNHPNILVVYDVGTDAGTTYIVTELLEGRTLRATLAQGPLQLGDAVGYGVAIAEALAAAHEKGIVHRDVKPENVFITAAGGVKILDFGLAKFDESWRPAEELATFDTAVAPMTGDLLIGTIEYMSPEQLRGQAADHRTDIFSFGAVLYEMLAGERAFSGETPADTIVAILNSAPRQIALGSSTIAPALRGIVARCLEKNATERFQSASDLAFALASASFESTRSLPSRSYKLRRAELPQDSHPRTTARHGVTSLSGPEESIAVLAYNDSGQRELQYLIDGISEGLTNRLARLPHVRVVPWIMVLRLKTHDSDLTATARELGARTLVVLRLMAHGDSYAMQAEWFDAGRKAHLWGGRYDVAAADVFRLEDELAVDLADQIRPGLTSSQVAELGKRHTSDGHAYDSYLKGRHLWNKRTPDALTKSIQHYRRAVGSDSRFALAFAAMADSYLTLAGFGLSSPEASVPEARAAATRALEIENTLGEARATLAVIHALCDWEWQAAEREFHQAMRLAPKYATARHWHGFILCAAGRFEAGMQFLKAAIDLEPLSPMIGTQLATGYYLQRRYDEGIAACKDVLDIDPDFWVAKLFFALCHVAAGRAQEALVHLRAAVDLSANNTLAVAALGHALAICNERDAADRLLSRLHARSATEYVPPYTFALIQCGLNQRQAALTYLEQAMEERSPMLALWIRGEPRLDPLRSEARFQGILEQMRLA